MMSLSLILVSIYLVINTDAYFWISNLVKTWLQEHQGDQEVLSITISYLDLLDTHHQPILFGVIAAVVLHLLLSLLLLLGAMLYKHLLLIPWMVTDMLIIVILFLVFAVWSFLSFFVGLLAAIIFPFIAGLALGIKIMLWRQVMTLYCLQVEVINVNKQYEVLRNNEAAIGAKRKISSIAEANETVA